MPQNGGLITQTCPGTDRGGWAGRNKKEHPKPQNAENITTKPIRKPPTPNPRKTENYRDAAAILFRRHILAPPPLSGDMAVFFFNVFPVPYG